MHVVGYDFGLLLVLCAGDTQVDARVILLRSQLLLDLSSGSVDNSIHICRPFVDLLLEEPGHSSEYDIGDFF
jgi:hypothetical protein